MTGVRLNRQQLAAAERLAGTVFVTAGAGSGKTRVLTERTANALIPGAIAGWEAAGIDEVLAITFTDKAAGELAERVRGALRSAGRRDLANRMDVSWISTIHGMCARILRSEALELGLNPGFAVLDAVQSGQMREQALEYAVSECAQPGSTVSVTIAERGYGTVAETVFRLASDLRTRGMTVDDVVCEAHAGFDELVALSLDLLTKGTEGSGEGNATAIGNRGKCVSASHLLKQLRATGESDEDAARRLYAVLCEARLTKRGSAEQKQFAEDFNEDLAQLMRAANAVIAARDARSVLELARVYSDRFDQLKRDVGALDFDDLQLKTREALEDEAIAERWRDRFRLVMVDEFQDTDSLQLEIVRLLAGENLCTVGDEQQSIYRFRGADVEVYRAQANIARAHGSPPVVLDTNYRSHPAVLDFVNRVFSSPAMFGDSLVDLKPGRSEDEATAVPEGTHRVELLVAEKSGGDGPARRALADAIAARARGFLDAGFTADDIVVLVSRYRHADAYAEALRSHGVPALVVGGSRFFDVPVVGILRSALLLVRNRRDDAAAARLLVSPACGVSDRGLAALRISATEQGTGLMEAFGRAELDASDAMRVSAAAAAVEEARGLVGRRPLAEVVTRLAETLGLDLRALGEGGAGAHAYVNVLKFARLAAAFESAGGSGVSGFLDHLSAKERLRDSEAPAALGGAECGAVRVMSIHAAKGLEFPVVFAAELGAGGASDRTLARWRFSPSADFAMLAPKLCEKQHASRETPLSLQIRDDGKEAAAAEERRKLYVACTRAKEILVLAGAKSFKSTEDTTSMLDMVVASLGVALTPGCTEANVSPGAADLQVSIVEPTDEEPDAGLPIAREADLAAEQRWFEALHPTAGDGTSHPAPRSLSYSSVSFYRRCPLRFRAARELNISAAATADSPAVRLGTALHAMLELYGEDLVPDPARVEAIFRMHALEPSSQERAKSAFERYRSSALADEVRSRDRILREAPIAVAVQSSEDEGFVLVGNVDVYAVSAARGALVVDFKTGDPGEDVGRLRERYELQARCYALAALADGNETAEAVFVLPEVEDTSGEPIQVRFTFDKGDEHTIRAELIDVWRAIADRHFDPLPCYDEQTCDACPVPSRICATRAAHRASVQ